jgi:hypothetical protein
METVTYICPKTVTQPPPLFPVAIKPYQYIMPPYASDAGMPQSVT